MFKKDNKEIHYRTYSQHWPIFQILLEKIPGYGNSDWYFSLSARRTIQPGEPIKASDIQEWWNFGPVPAKAAVSANAKKNLDYIVTDISYNLHPLCVETIVAGKQIHAHQIKFLDSN